MSTVLVTGAARGIGKAISSHLAEAGWEVFAGVRSEQDAAALSRGGRATPVMLDVTNEEHIAALCGALPSRVDAVVNNAGIAVSGPIETVTPTELRRQLEVNVVGPIAVTQALLPRLRESRGRIVFISSVNGRISAPMLGAYCASKFALEAAADALRMELRPWEIAVSVVEPAQTDTDLWRRADTTVDEMEAAMPSEQRVLYAKHIAGMRKSIPLAQRLAAGPEKVAAVVAEALTSSRPRARYPVGFGPALQMAFVSNMPSAFRDPIISKVFRQP
jgi:NAD(P)-dependent dehydrogenase (short-subunit alcohol dehydrogenase family)